MLFVLPQSLCKESGLCRKWMCQSSPKVPVRRCTGRTRQSRWTSCTTWSALDTRRAARTPARYCWISCCCAAVFTFTNTRLHIRAKQEPALKTTHPQCSLWDLPFEHFDTSQWWKLKKSVCVCVVFSGWFRRAPCLPDGKWDLGASWGGEFRTGLCRPKQARCVCQTDQLLQLHQQHGTRDPAVWPSSSEQVLGGCHVGQLSVHSTDPASEIRHFENWSSGK